MSCLMPSNKFLLFTHFCNTLRTCTSLLTEWWERGDPHCKLENKRFLWMHNVFVVVITVSHLVHTPNKSPDAYSMFWCRNLMLHWDGGAKQIMKYHDGYCTTAKKAGVLVFIWESKGMKKEEEFPLLFSFIPCRTPWLPKLIIQSE